jgi:hypothetical protein
MYHSTAAVLVLLSMSPTKEYSRSAGAASSPPVPM